MKQPTLPSSQLLRRFSKSAWLLGVTLTLAGSAATSQASSILKANDADDLDLTTSWVGGVVPGPTNVAVWDSTVTSPNSTLLAANLSWSGVQILGPGGAVSIGATSTNANLGATLTLGAGGIDMSGASQSLTVMAPVALLGGSVQTWNVISGQSLTLQGAFTRSAGSELRFTSSTGGTINIAKGTASAVLPYTIIDGNDVGALDASFNVSTVNTVLGYSQNLVSTTPSSAYVDMVNAASGTADDTTIAASSFTPVVIRFNTPQPNRNYWQYNAATHVNYVASPGQTVLVTTNVGAQDVIMEGSSHAFRWNGAELHLDQENPAGTLYVDGSTSSRGTASANVLTKLGVGRVVFNAPINNGGAINILNGELMINSTTASGAALSVQNGGTLSGSGTISDATTVNAGGVIHPGTTNGLGTLTVPALTLNAGGGLTFYSAPVPTTNTTGLLNVTGVLTVNGAVNVAVVSGTPVIGQYPLLKWTNAISAPMFANFNLVTLPLRTRGYLSNNTANSTIDLVVTNVNEPIKWNAGSSTWDTLAVSWLDTTGAGTSYVETNESGSALSDSVLFDDTTPGTSPITVTLNTALSPVAVTVNNSSKEYMLGGTGSIVGPGGFTKSGSGMLVLQSANTFAGGININGGILNFSAMTQLGSGAINFGGGTLQYASGTVDDISARTVTFNAGGGTIDDGGNTLTFANAIGNKGAGGLTKAGSGTLTLNGTNVYSGNTVVSQGTLYLGAAATLPNSAALIVNGGATLDASQTGVGLTLSGTASQMLAGSGTVNGDVTAPDSTTISPAGSGSYGTLSLGGALTVSGGTLVMDVSSPTKDMITVAGSLTLNNGTLQLNVSGSLPVGRYKLIQYPSGSLAGAAGNLTLVGFAQSGASATLDDSVSGEIDLVVAPNANDTLTWPGTGSTWALDGTMDWLNGSTPWAYTNGDTVTFNDSASSSTVNLQGVLSPASVTVNNSTIPTYTFADGTGSGGGKIIGAGSLTKDGTGMLVVQTANAYTGATTIKNGTLQIGNGGIGDIGKGNVTNNGALIFAQGDTATHFVDGVVSGSGSVTENGNATVVLTNNNTYTGPTTISAGTLQVGVGGPTGSLGTDLAVTNDGTLALDVSGSSSFPYNVSGAGALVDQGSGKIDLTGSLTYLGNTYISNGVVKLHANNQIPSVNTAAGSTGWLILDGGATSAGAFDLNGFNQTVNALSGLAGTVNSFITNSGSSATTTNVLTVLNLNTTTVTYNGQIMNGAAGAKTAVFVTGPGILTLNPATNSTFGGGLTVSNSTVALGSPGSAATVNIYESVLAPGTGPITLAGTNGILYLCGSGGSSTSPTYTPLTNTVVIPAGQTGTVYGPCRGANNGAVTGSGTLYYDTTYVRGSIGGDWSGFAGQVTFSGDSSGGNLGVNSTNGFPNASVSMNTNMAFYGTVTGNPTIPIGALSGGDSSDQIQGAETGNNDGAQPTVFAIGGLNTSTTYSGAILDNVSLLKVGTGTLTLNAGGVLSTNVVLNGLFYTTNIGYGTNMIFYTGTTTISNGVLQLVTPAALPNSTNVTIASSSAVLDATLMGYVTNLDTPLPDGQTNTLVTNGVFEAVSGQTLGGIGTLRGGILADAGSVLSVGLPMGSLNVTSNVDLAGTVMMSVDSSGTVTNSELVAPAISVESSATLVVTNLGGELGATFKLFSQPVSFNTVDLPTLTGTNVWVDHLSVDGTITLLAPVVNTAPTNIVFAASAGNVTLSWPSDHTGWTLQMQTNSVAQGLGTNWVNVTGSDTTNQITMPINSTNGAVFFRMIYP